MNFKTLRLPDGGTGDRGLFEFKPRAGADPGKKPGEGNRVNHLGFHLGPVKLIFIDPQLAAHADQNFRLAIHGLVAGLGSGGQHIGGTAGDSLFAGQMKRERNRHLRH